jgi:hypothetical protein
VPKTLTRDGPKTTIPEATSVIVLASIRLPWIETAPGPRICTAVPPDVEIMLPPMPHSWQELIAIAVEPIGELLLIC